jgi:hypothetical protein
LWVVPYFAGAVAAHALSTRLPRGNPIVKFLLVGAVGGGALACHLLWAEGLSLAAMAGLAAYAFACELYLFLFTLVASSVSVRLLLLLLERDRSAGEIRELYEPRGMVARRVERLLAAGLLERDGGSYRVSARGRRLVGLFVALKAFCRHPEERPPPAPTAP